MAESETPSGAHATETQIGAPQGHYYGSVQGSGDAQVIVGNVQNLQNVTHIHQGGTAPAEDRKPDVMQVLRYEGMSNKRDASTPKSSYNHEWIWKTQFAEWLRCVDGNRRNRPFWICGKPGSGKSTLVAYLVDEPQTYKLLQSRGHSYKIINYFYDYNSGKLLANNIVGMLRMLLYQLADQDEAVKARLQNLLERDELKLHSRETLLRTTCKALKIPNIQFCIFIDGLDEYEGTRFELLETLESLNKQSNVVLCLACRPEVEVAQAFAIYSTIHMQDHNRDSMYKYAHGEILKAKETDLDIERRCTPPLIGELVTKAEGIMLWFRLAFNQLLMMSGQDATPETIQNYVRNMPIGLDAMYDRILNRISPKHRKEAALFLILYQKLRRLRDSNGLDDVDSCDNKGSSSDCDCLSYTSTTTFDHLWGAYDFIADQHGQTLAISKHEDIRDMQNRIKTILCGLLEVYSVWILDPFPPPYGVHKDGCDLEVRFIHRSFDVYLQRLQSCEFGNSETQDMNFVVTLKSVIAQIEGIYSKPFWLRMFSEIIVRADSDGIISRHFLEQGAEELVEFLRPIDSKKFSDLIRRYARLLKDRSFATAVFKEFCPNFQRLPIEPSYRKLNLMQRTFNKIIASRSHSCPLPKKWKSRYVLLRTSFLCMFHLSRAYEDVGLSSFHLISPALRSDLGRLTLLCCCGVRWRAYWGVCGEILLGSFSNQSFNRMYGLVAALVNDLPAFYEKALSQIELTEDEVWRLKDAIFEAVVKIRQNPRISLLAAMRPLNVWPCSQDFTYIMRNAQCVVLAAHHMQSAAQAWTYRKSKGACMGHGDHLKKDEDSETFLAWADLLCFMGRCDPKKIAMQYYTMLKALVCIGLKINEECSLKAPFFRSLLLHQAYPQHMRDKFIALVWMDVDCSTQISHKNELEIARARMLNRRDEDSRVRQALQASEKEDLQFIIECLEYRQKHACWPTDKINADVSTQSFEYIRGKTITCEDRW